MFQIYVYKVLCQKRLHRNMAKEPNVDTRNDCKCITVRWRKCILDADTNKYFSKQPW